VRKREREREREGGIYERTETEAISEKWERDQIKKECREYQEEKES
jgi:hypothetical protein